MSSSQLEIAYLRKLRQAGGGISTRRQEDLRVFYTSKPVLVIDVRLRIYAPESIRSEILLARIAYYRLEHTCSWGFALRSFDGSFLVVSYPLLPYSCCGFSDFLLFLVQELPAKSVLSAAELKRRKRCSEQARVR